MRPINTKKQKDSVIRDWCKALKSGKYKQGKGMLYNRESRKYCCLGVLGRIAGLKPVACDGTLSNRSSVRGTEFHYKGEGPSSNIQYLPEDFWDEIVKYSENALTQEDLVDMNDSDDALSFQEIADYIHQTYFGKPMSKRKKK
jgi:hypothetical protein